MSLSGFNSIKVRLEQFAGASVLDIELFQFHKGTIRTDVNTDIAKGTLSVSIP